VEKSRVRVIFPLFSLSVKRESRSRVEKRNQLILDFLVLFPLLFFLWKRREKRSE
jgi:hypothetical protein